MKFTKIFVFAAMALMSGVVMADPIYPYTNPTYIPNAVFNPVSYTAPVDISFLTNGIGTVSLRVSGTCTSLAATVLASNDAGANTTAVNLYPIATGTTAPVAVASIGAVGFWKINTVGYNLIKVHVTALTASCTFAMVGTPGGFNGTNF